MHESLNELRKQTASRAPILTARTWHVWLSPFELKDVGDSQKSCHLSFAAKERDAKADRSPIDSAKPQPVRAPSRVSTCGITL